MSKIPAPKGFTTNHIPSRIPGPSGNGPVTGNKGGGQAKSGGGFSTAVKPAFVK